MCNNHPSPVTAARGRKRKTPPGGVRTIADRGKNIDPTRTVTLRNEYEREFRRRFRSIMKAIRREIVELDEFGLRTNKKFDFLTDQEKIASFNAWLSQQINKALFDGDLSEAFDVAADRFWGNSFANIAYRRGLLKSVADIKRAGGRVADTYVESALSRGQHVETLKRLATRQYEDLQGITSKMSQQIGEQLAEGLAEGKGPFEIASALNDRVAKIGLTRARLLARTEIISAFNEAELNSYTDAGIQGVELEPELLTAGDDRVCEECENAAGESYTVETARGVIPLHPNCLPGDSLVLSRSGITAVSKRWFDGDMIIVTTASGRKLTCTPNHPILTDAGWQPAHSIHFGDQVISDGAVDWSGGRSGDDKDVPTPIREIADAFGSSRSVSSVPMPVSTPDFHGDGMTGDIAEIWTDRKLRLKLDIAFRQKIAQVGLMMADISDRIVARISTFDFLSLDDFAAPDGIVGSGDLSRTLFRGHSQPLDGLGFRLGLQPDTARNESVFNSSTADTDLARKIIDGSTGPVFRDKVVNVDVQSFSGYVYNLESGNHSYVAQGVVNHNCRCAWAPLIVNGREIGLQ